MLHKEASLLSAICAYYSWETALNVGLEASFYKVKNWKGKEAGKVNSRNKILNGCCTSKYIKNINKK
jgi:hypothetical protein